MNNVYKVLVADDEYPFIQSMSKYEWAEHSCVLVGTALNGAEALRKCEMLKPQILLTDINMPQMNGIDLIKEVKLILPDTQIILFTVYKEFEYAHEAIQLGVVDYVLKDAMIKDKIWSAIEKAKSQYDKETISVTLPKSVSRIVYMSSVHQPIEQLLGNDDKGFCLLSIRVQSAGSVRSTIYPEALVGLVSDGEYLLFYDEHNFGFLLRQADERKIAGVIRGVEEGIDHKVQYAYTKYRFRLSEYQNAYNENLYILDDCFYEGKLMKPFSRNPLSSETVNEWIKICTNLSAIGDIAGFIDGTVETAAVNNYYAPSAVRKAFERILYRFEMKYGIEDDNDSRKRIRESNTLSELKNEFLTEINRIIPAEKPHSRIVSYTLESIEGHVHEPDFQLSQIAAELEISTDHITKRLKEEIGLGFQELLLRTRMRKAMSLLQNTNMKIYEIAEACGYSGYRSFVNAFTNFYNKSPKSYR